MMPEFSCNATLDSIAAFKLLKKFIKLCHMISYQIIQSLEVRTAYIQIRPSNWQPFYISLSVYLCQNICITTLSVCHCHTMCFCLFFCHRDIFNIYFAYNYSVFLSALFGKIDRKDWCFSAALRWRKNWKYFVFWIFGLVSFGCFRV